MGIPGGPVVENPPTNEGNTGWILDLGGSPKPCWGAAVLTRHPCRAVLQPWSPTARAPEPHTRGRMLQEGPPHRSWRVAPARCNQRRKSPSSSEDSAYPKQEWMNEWMNKQKPMTRVSLETVNRLTRAKSWQQQTGENVNQSKTKLWRVLKVRQWNAGLIWKEEVESSWRFSNTVAAILCGPQDYEAESKGVG